MASKVITISLPESLDWKISQLSQSTGIPKSTLIAKAILLLISKLTAKGTPGLITFNKEYSIEDIEKEFSNRGA